jgi:hypothetical protein
MESPLTIAPDQELTIIRLYHAEHWPIGTIARQLRVHHETVQRVLAQADMLPAVTLSVCTLIERDVVRINDPCERRSGAVFGDRSGVDCDTGGLTRCGSRDAGRGGRAHCGDGREGGGVTTSSAIDRRFWGCSGFDAQGRWVGARRRRRVRGSVPQYH